MFRPLQPRQASALDPPEDPAVQDAAPWPLPIVLALAVAGLLSPLIPLAAAVLAYAIADEDQGTFLLGAGMVHVVLVLTLLSGA
jgi:hypothetical protein